MEQYQDGIEHGIKQDIIKDKVKTKINMISHYLKMVFC